MSWPIIESLYKIFWPLFEPCTDRSMTIVHSAAVPFTTRLYGNVFEGVQHAEMTVGLCPTPMMHLLLGLAFIGLVFLLTGCLHLLEVMTERPIPASAHHDVVVAILKELDRVSDEHLRRVNRTADKGGGFGRQSRT